MAVVTESLELAQIEEEHRDEGHADPVVIELKDIEKKTGDTNVQATDFERKGENGNGKAFLN